MVHDATQADLKIQTCLDENRSFAVIAGAGSGKTTSLVKALRYLKGTYGKRLRRDGNKVVCITYTKRARDVLKHKLNDESLFEISTIHSFLWGEINRFHQDIAAIITETIIPVKINKLSERTKGNSHKAQKARADIRGLEVVLPMVAEVGTFVYDDGMFSDFAAGKIGHDDVIDIAAEMIQARPLLRKIIGQKYPYILVDEAQDTFPNVVEALNLICAPEGLPIVGYFGDPMQQIYDKRAGQFEGPEGCRTIEKEENFRSAKSVIKLANALRSDLQQIPAGPNSDTEGEVSLLIIEAEEPGAPRKRYTEEQLDRALERFDRALIDFEWQDAPSNKRLYLAHQMIARRLGFLSLHKLFHGDFASQRAEEQFDDGSHFLLKPIVEVIWPIVLASETGDELGVLATLREHSPAYARDGDKAGTSLDKMIIEAKAHSEQLRALWLEKPVKDILLYAQAKEICRIGERLGQHLEREPRVEEYDVESHGAERSDWLTDAFLASSTDELAAYCAFVTDNTPFSTQHGVKGEEYDEVLVLFDDVEAGWNNYSFSKLFIPGIVGAGTEGQIMRSLRLAYVCFTRAQKVLRIVLFCPTPEAAKAELVAAGLFSHDQVSVLPLSIT